MATNVQSKKLRYMVMTAMLAAASTVLMFLSFPLPFMPPYIKMDFSELPALIAAFTMGPWYGVLVCFVKNLINLPFSTTACVGEISNFLLGVLLVVPAGLLHKRKPGYGSAVVGSLTGSASMAVFGLVTNYFVVYPLYAKILIPMDAIMNMYTSLVPAADTLWKALLIFNMPFTFFKGLCSALIAILLYKPLAPIIRGRTPN